MRAFHTPDSAAHDPDTYFRRGTIVTHPEQADRYAILLHAVSGGHHVATTPDHGLDPIVAAHDLGYVEFLRDSWDRRGELPNVDNEILSGHFARPHMHRRPSSLLGLTGYYLADTSTPIRSGTWKAVYGAAQVAVSTADAALDGGRAYGLCRPPGHHAYADSAGGFCFLNNSAIAASRLLARAGRPDARVAILDIDVHHGNGTQGIFYERADVLTVSIHADPIRFYPFFWGHAHERGEGAGLGCNLNLPPQRGTGDDDYLAALDTGLERIAAFGADVVVVALGLDAHEADPLKGLAVTTKGFARIGAALAGLGLPLLLVQEGGYLSEALGRNLTNLLNGIRSSGTPA
jgi:acetoin utilization deacetylase AcuC-like enzyme